MNIESKSKWQLRFATLSVFLLGFLAGALALNAYHLWFGASKPPTTRREKYEEILNRLKLNETQKAEVQRIFGETRENIQKMRQESEPRLQEMRSQHDEKLQKVLTPEQFQEYQQERDKLREADRPPPPKPLELK